MTGTTFSPARTAYDRGIQNKLNTNENIADSLSNHVIGRISCAARIPFQVLGSLFQALKILIKLPISLVATPVVYFRGEEGYDFLTIKGIYNDTIGLYSLLKETSQAAEWVITAPEENSYPSFFEACSKTLDVIIGDYGTLIQENASSKSSSQDSL